MRDRCRAGHFVAESGFCDRCDPGERARWTFYPQGYNQEPAPSPPRKPLFDLRQVRGDGIQGELV